MEARKAKPLGDRVLIKEAKQPEDRRTASGIIIPETVTADDVKFGTVVAVGDGLFTQNGVSIPMSVKVGDTVILPSYGNGQTIKTSTQEYVLYRESDLLMVVPAEAEVTSLEEIELSF
jgi:chaperonin GroES